MVKGAAGVLVQADESVMAIIKKIDAERPMDRIIIHNLGDEACVVKPDKLAELESRVKKIIQEKVPNPKDSDDEDEGKR